MTLIKEAVSLLSYLLPGFVSAAVLYTLTPNPRPSPFERVIQAFIFTIVTQALTVLTREMLLLAGSFWSFGAWTGDTQLVWSVLNACALGLALAYGRNHDTLHALLRRAGFTHQTSYSSEWYGAFCNNHSYVVLHLTGERRLYGWAQEWPSEPTVGHFVLAMPEWLLADGKTTPATGVATVLVPAVEVEIVEFMKPSTTQGGNHG